MIKSGNIINNNALAALSQRAGPSLTATIQTASTRTGVDFTYLMEKAAAESSFKTDAQAKTSSARGLYQFIESTWLQMVSRYGDKHGLGHYAEQISDRGKVADPALRREILALRDDPEIAAMMAGEFAAENKRSMVNAGIPADDIGSTELYFAHFLGAGAASAFLKSMKENPLTPAADLFPKAAKANRNVFYNPKTQQARSLGEIYAFFDRKFINTPAPAQGPAAGAAMIAQNTAPQTTTSAQKTAAAIPTPTQTARIDLAMRTQKIHVQNTPNGMNQMNMDLLAMMNPSLFSQGEPEMYFGQRIITTPAVLPPNGATRNLVSDPVALMLMAKMDTSSEGTTHNRVKPDSTEKDKNDRDRHASNARADLCSALELNLSL